MLEEEFSRAWCSLDAPGPFTLLLSGGGDSVALFHLLRLTGVDFCALHFEHDGDPEFTREGRQFCIGLCREFTVPLTLRPVAGRSLMGDGDLSWEAACRTLRYRAASRLEGTCLTGHTMDDQAETLVMRLLDGSGLAGLAGIAPLRDDGVARPLLTFERERLRRFLTDHGFRWIEDPSNSDGNDRAKLRNQIMPLLQAQRPHLMKTLSRSSRRFAADEKFLIGCTLDWMREHTSPEGDSWPLARVQALPSPLLARFLKLVWKAFGPCQYRPRATLYEECFRVLKSGSNDAWVLFPGGWSLGILGGKVWARPSLATAGYSLCDPFAEGPLPDFLKVSRGSFAGANRWSLPKGATLRCRRGGDQYRGRSLKKVLAGTGQPPWVRDRWPVLAVESEVLKVWSLDPAEEISGSPDFWIRYDVANLRGSVWPLLEKMGSK